MLAVARIVTFNDVAGYCIESEGEEVSTMYAIRLGRFV